MDYEQILAIINVLAGLQDFFAVLVCSDLYNLAKILWYAIK